MEDLFPIKHMVPWVHMSLFPIGISIDSAVFAWLMVVPKMQTQTRVTYVVTGHIDAVEGRAI